MSYSNCPTLHKSKHNKDYLLLKGDVEVFHNELVSNCKAVWNSKLEGWLVPNNKITQNGVEQVEQKIFKLYKNKQIKKTPTVRKNSKGYLTPESDSESDIDLSLCVPTTLTRTTSPLNEGLLGHRPSPSHKDSIYSDSEDVVSLARHVRKLQMKINELDKIVKTLAR